MKLKQQLRVGLVSALLFLGACSFAPKTVEVSSTPIGAEIYLIDNSGAEKRLGETPFKLNREVIDTLRDDLLVMRFQKEGYEVERLYIDLPSKNLSGSINVQLKDSTDWSQAFVDKKASKYLDDVARMTAEVQGAMGSKDLSRAEIKARALVNRYPNLAVAWSLLGNVLFLQNRKSEAMEAYNRSLGIDPTNQETRNVIDKMKGIQ
ncbi:hypothetical protein GW916_01800 [bacterium]|nr:hypothetical protein [bacterium]